MNWLKCLKRRVNKINTGELLAFFNATRLLDSKKILKPSEFIELSVVIYLMLTENKFNIDEKASPPSNTYQDTRLIDPASKSIVKQKIGEFGLVNLGEIYLRFKNQSKEIGSKAFIALISLISNDHKELPLLNIYHKILDTNDNMTFKTLYCLLLYTRHQYELCEKVSEKSLHNSSTVPDNSNYK